MPPLRVLLLALLATSPAFAQGEDAVPAPMPAPVPTVPPLTLPEGRLQIAGQTLNINLSADNAGKPISLAPSVYYGFDNTITIGVTHDGGTTPLTPRPAITFASLSFGGMRQRLPAFGGICVNSELDGCYKGTYDNIGADLLYSLERDVLSIAVHSGLDAFAIEPLALQLRVGALIRYVTGSVSVVADPRLIIGLTEREDEVTGTTTNGEQADIPLWLWFSASPELSAYLHTGIGGSLDDFGESYAVPLGFGGNYKLADDITTGLDFSFVNLLGNGGSADYRVLSARLIYSM